MYMLDDMASRCPRSGQRTLPGKRPHDVSMIFLWDSYGMSEGILWEFHGILMGFLCGSYAISMLYLWSFYGISVGFLWDFYDKSIELKFKLNWNQLKINWK